MEVVIYGIINSVILSLYALGFTLVYSISRLPNFAHGALYVTCGYLVFVVTNSLGLPYPLAVIIGIAATSLIGAVIYRFILIRIRGMEISEIIATYAVGLAMLEGAVLVLPQSREIVDIEGWHPAGIATVDSKGESHESFQVAEISHATDLKGHAPLLVEMFDVLAGSQTLAERRRANG